MIGEDQSKRKKKIAFRTTTDTKDELDDNDVVLLTRKFKNFFSKNISEKEANLSKQKGTDMMCFKQEMKHIKVDCALLNKDKFKKRINSSRNLEWIWQNDIEYDSKKWKNHLFASWNYPMT